MTTVFIAGSISIKKLDLLVQERIDKIVSSGLQVIIGDANGIDSAIQNYLAELKYNNVMVYCSNKTPRNNLGNWKVTHVHTSHKKGTREFFTAKDEKMAMDADIGFMVWDAVSLGTLKNIKELSSFNKTVVVFVHKRKEFVNIRSVTDLEKLISEFVSIKEDNFIKRKATPSAPKISMQEKQHQLFGF